MNFNEVLLSAELVIKSEGVPLIIGESGIGKTALVKEIAKRNKFSYIVIDGNMLKEGEIGGLPTIEEYESYENGVKVLKKRTVYAIHSKLQEIEKISASDSEKEVLLFIDEINRCEHSVQQELMNIILNREINGYKLPNNVYVVSAMNPSNKYSNYEDSDYQVIDMDPAQENRFVWLEMESDIKSWISWAINSGINNNVVEFLSTFPNFLHTPNIRESVKATPRSWERVSKTLNVYFENMEYYSNKTLFNVIKGNVGVSIAQEFINFLEDNSNPLIKVERLLENDFLDEEIKEKLKAESHSRLYLLAKNVLNYLKEKDPKENYFDIFCEMLTLYPVDLRISIMVEVKKDYTDVYQKLLNKTSFIDNYFSAFIET
ncbi:MAG: AAA family ATPase [Clostridiaceae bacterium]